jgi:hypothetical protein
MELPHVVLSIPKVFHKLFALVTAMDVDCVSGLDVLLDIAFHLVALHALIARPFVGVLWIADDAGITEHLAGRRAFKLVLPRFQS